MCQCVSFNLVSRLTNTCKVFSIFIPNSIFTDLWEHRTIPTGVACQQGSLTLLMGGGGVAYACIFETIFTETFPDIFSIITSKTPPSLVYFTPFIFRNGRRVHRFILCEIIWCPRWVCTLPFLDCVLLYLRSSKGGCCSISDYLSCSCIFGYQGPKLNPFLSMTTVL